MHTYEIILNKRCDTALPPYSFGWNKDIRLGVEPGKACIRFSANALKTVEDMINFRYMVFRDAYRKVILLHAVNYSVNLQVARMEFIIDGESTVLTKENDTSGHFPYMVSMIRPGDLHLGKGWKGVSEALLTTVKSKADRDLRFAAVYGYLASKNREFTVERFSNLWTAMNAYYSYLAGRYEERTMEKYGLSRLSGKLSLMGKDAESIGLLAWLLDQRYTDIFDKEKLARLWNDNYVVESAVRHYSKEEIRELYRASLDELRGKPLDEKYQPLAERAAEFGVRLFVFLLLDFSYNWRCTLFHGNHTTMLICAHNDYEVAALNVVNHFLDSFLDQEIPGLFKEDYWDEKKQTLAEQYVGRLRTMEKNAEARKKGKEGKKITFRELMENHRKALEEEAAKKKREEEAAQKKREEEAADQNKITE